MIELIGTKYCMAANSYTSALIAAYRSLGIGMGDEVIVPAYTFFATSATVVASNAIPIIADVDETLCMDAPRYRYLPGDLSARCRDYQRGIDGNESGKCALRWHL